MTMAGFTAIAWWNVVELNYNVYMTFKKRRGLYFWALLVSSWGVIGHSLSLLFKFFTNFNPYWICTLLMIGWWAMVSYFLACLGIALLTIIIGQLPVFGALFASAPRCT